MVGIVCLSPIFLGFSQEHVSSALLSIGTKVYRPFSRAFLKNGISNQLCNSFASLSPIFSGFSQELRTMTNLRKCINLSPIISGFSQELYLISNISRTMKIYRPLSRAFLKNYHYLLPIIGAEIIYRPLSRAFLKNRNVNLINTEVK